MFRYIIHILSLKILKKEITHWIVTILQYFLRISGTQTKVENINILSNDNRNNIQQEKTTSVKFNKILTDKIIFTVLDSYPSNKIYISSIGIQKRGKLFNIPILVCTLILIKIATASK